MDLNAAKFYLFFFSRNVILSDGLVTYVTRASGLP